MVYNDINKSCSQNPITLSYLTKYNKSEVFIKKEKIKQLHKTIKMV